MEGKKKGQEILEKMGLKKSFKQFPRELSGGECQRVAVARALMNHPDLILADEPSGNLDEGNSEMLNELFGELNQKLNQTFLIVSHDERLAKKASRRLHMHGGIVENINKENRL